MKTENFSISLIFHYCISESSAPAPPLPSKGYNAISKEAEKVKPIELFQTSMQRGKQFFIVVCFTCLSYLSFCLVNRLSNFPFYTSHPQVFY